MAFHPDYGLALIRSGVAPGFQASFYSLHLDHITVIGPGEFTTLITVPVDGEEHALSLDFGADILGGIMADAQPTTCARLHAWPLGCRGGDTFQLPELITFGASATLGEVQKAQKEEYVPLIIHELLQ